MDVYIKRAVLFLLAVGVLSQTSTARGDEPIRGKLEFKSRKANFDGTNVGQEGDTPKYIAGHPDSPQRAIWGFETLPRSMQKPAGDLVPAKLTCSIFRLDPNTPVSVELVIRVVSHTCPQAPPNQEPKGEWQWQDKNPDMKKKYEEALAAYQTKKIDPLASKPTAEEWKAANALAEKYGFYEVRLPKVFDGAETSFNLPAGLFRNAAKTNPKLDGDGMPVQPRVSVYMKCETPGLLLGVAEADFHFVEKTPAKK